MDRGELEGLDRESLVVRAQAAGIRRARILTRPELIDELLRLDPNVDDAQLKKSRGFFGRARDLVARVVERGLHLPDAADRIRTITGGGGLTLTVPRTEPQAMPTVTLAEIYAAQGHSKRAIETLRRVLEREPEHAAARALLARLEDAGYVAPPPPLPPEPEHDAELTTADDESQAADERSVTDDAVPDTDAAGDAPTVDNGLYGRHASGPPPEMTSLGIQGPSYEGSNGEAEYYLAPASERDPKRDLAPEESDDPAYAQTRELPRGTGRSYAYAVPRAERVVIPAPKPAPAPVAVASLPVETVSDEEIDECIAIPLSRSEGSAGARTYVRWNVSFSAIGALLRARPRGRFVVRAHIVTPGWDGSNSETRDLAIDPDAGETTLLAIPDPSVVRVAIGWLDDAGFVPLAHSAAFETHPRGLAIWTPKGTVPVVLEDPRCASIKRAFDGSKRVAQAPL